MLILTRERGQKVFIETSDGRITVIVLERRAGKLRLGFDAPRTVEIMRDDASNTAPRERRLD